MTAECHVVDNSHRPAPNCTGQLVRQVVPAANKSETPTARRYAAKGKLITIATREIDGRMVVAYVEVPEGANASLVDLAKVTLR